MLLAVHVPPLVLAAILPSDAVLRHATELRDRGFCVIPHVGISAAQVEAAQADCMHTWRKLTGAVAAIGIEPEGQDYDFAEINTRHRHRWDYRPTRPGAWTQLIDEAVAAASPVVEAVHMSLALNPQDGLPLVSAITRNAASGTPRIDQVGAILSRPGAQAQRFHQDADAGHCRMARLLPRYRLYNAFVPLVHIAEGTDGTMFWPGSHVDGDERLHAAASRGAEREQDDGTQAHLEDDATAMTEMVCPACPAGGLVLFDMRIVHRGLPNAGRDRAVAYAVLSTGGASDTANFGTTSLWHLKRGLDSLAADDERVLDEWREAERREIGSRCLRWEELYEQQPKGERFLEPRARYKA